MGMITVAANPLSFELPHTLMLLWLLAGCLALWAAQKLHVPKQKTINILLPMGLGLIVFATYVTTRYNYDFLIDDVDIIQTNPDVVEADGWRTLWTSDYWSGRSTDDNLYRPITILSYWVNARLPLCARIVDGRAEEIFTRYFRGVNIVLLTGLAWLIALWLSHYVQLTAAWVMAFLFAGHAAHGEMVNYIVCRADLLTMLGIVGFLYMQRLALEAGRWRWWTMLLALFSAAVAFGSKETGLILLPAALAQAWIGTRHADTDITDDLPVIPRSVHLGWIVLLLLPLIAWLAARIAVVGMGVDYSTPFMDDLRDNPLRRVSLLERLPAAFAIAWFYLRQLIFPSTAYYHLPVELPTFASREAILGLTLMISMVLLLIWYTRRHRWMLIGIVIAMGQYLIVGNLLKPVGVYAANRLILPFSLAGCIMGAALLHAFCQKSTRRRAVIILPAIVLMGIMGLQIQTVNHVWRTEARLMGHDLSINPDHPVAKYNFGTVRAREGIFVDKYLRALTETVDLVAKVEAMQQQTEGDKTEKTTAVRQSLEQIRRRMADLSDSQHHRDLTQQLRDVLALIDRTIIRGNAMLTPADITGARAKLTEDLEEFGRLSEQYWGEAMQNMDQVVALRPKSLSGQLERGRILELRQVKTQALMQYRAMVNNAVDDSDLRVIEARIRYGRLCIELSVDPDGADRSLAIAAKLLELMLAKDTPLPPGKREEMVNLHRNALRYFGIVAWKANNLPLAIQRHDALLRRYRDFPEAEEDKQQWINQLTPPDQRD